jgi:hypothetical protein
MLYCTELRCVETNHELRRRLKRAGILFVVLGGAVETNHELRRRLKLMEKHLADLEEISVELEQINRRLRFHTCILTLHNAMLMALLFKVFAQ